MKKFFLSSTLILFFGIYAVYQRISGADYQNVRYQEQGPGASSVPYSAPSSPRYVPSESAPPALQAPVKRAASGYKDGEYTGGSVDAYYGNVQVRAVIQGGKITDVQFLDYPHDRRTSISINTYATPYLRSEAIQAQSAQVDIVSGATQTSGAFRESLATALAKAKL